MFGAVVSMGELDLEGIIMVASSGPDFPQLGLFCDNASRCIRT